MYFFLTPLAPLSQAALTPIIRPSYIKGVMGKSGIVQEVVPGIFVSRQIVTLPGENVSLILSVPSAYHEPDLLQLIAKGDEVAFRMFFDLYRDKLYAFVFRVVKSAHITEELVQDIFMKFWVNRAALATVENPSAYIFTIARNRRTDYLRKIAGEHAMMDIIWKRIAEKQNDTEEQVHLNELRRLIEASLQQLSPQKRNVFRMSRFEGLSNRQIAEKLGLTEGTVKNMMSDSLRHIRAYLEKNNVPLSIALAIVLSRP